LPEKLVNRMKLRMLIRMARDRILANQTWNTQANNPETSNLQAIQNSNSRLTRARMHKDTKELPGLLLDKGHITNCRQR
jgi:hypothetical protein